MPLASLLRAPHTWVRNLIALREKRRYGVLAVATLAGFVATGRAALELVVCAEPRSYAPEALLNNAAFYLQTAYLFALAASLLTGRPVRRVMGVVLVGIFLGILPPIIDSVVLGIGQCRYAYVERLSEWRPTLVDPAHFTIGETIVLWVTIAILAIYVAEVTRSALRALFAALIGYALVFVISAVPSSAARALLDALKEPLDFVVGAGGRQFRTPLVTAFELVIAQAAYLASRPRLLRRLVPRLVHALPFVALVLVGAAVSKLSIPAVWVVPNGYPIVLLLALAMFELCVIALVQNDAHDLPGETPDAVHPAAVTSDDARFFTLVGVLLVLSIASASGYIAAVLGVFLAASVAYSFGFFRAKRFFPGNYKIEGVWAWSAFVLGGFPHMPRTRLLPAEFLLASLLAFGGWSLFSALKDYKDLRADRRAKNQTLYALLRKRGIALGRVHATLRVGVAVALVIPPLIALYAGAHRTAAVVLAAAGAGAAFAVLGRGPRASTVRAFLVVVSVYLLGLALLLEWTAARRPRPVAPPPRSSPAAKPPVATRERMDAAIVRGVAFLRTAQDASGEFPIYAARTPDLAEGRPDSTTFATTFVLHALGAVAGHDLTSVRERAIAFLERERLPSGLFSYYTSRNPQKLPPDADDTAVAARALASHGRDSAMALQQILGHRDARGRFETWLGPNAPRREVDCVVNANVLFWLGDREETRASCAYLVELVTSRREAGCSSYYPDLLALYYAYARALSAGARCLEPGRQTVISRILSLRQPDAGYGIALSTALALTSLHSLGASDASLPHSSASLLSAQSSDGSWPRAAFYRSRVEHFGSEALSTALALEALSKARRGYQPPPDFGQSF